ncbi:TPA: type II secretion system protein, partial [Vibrio cholerae]|nr:type II secretion system protein [Vibrio cholerae]
MSKNQGFTLIELIIAIVILGVIAVIAAPRFINISKDAKANTMLSVAAGMESALTLLHSQALIEGQDIGKGEITINGVKTPLLNGYPSVNGKDSFEEINAQVQAWFNIDSVGK